MTDANEPVAAFLRFVPLAEREQALDAVTYAAAMLGPAVTRGTLESWCYELAAAGVPYQDWPEMVALRHARESEAGTDATPLEQARMASQAMGMVDYGEI